MGKITARRHDPSPEMNRPVDIRTLLVSEIPHVHRFARSLTRDSQAAEDLVQDCVVRAISRQHQLVHGANPRAWLFKILHNLFVSSVRKQKSWPADGELGALGPQPPVSPNQDDDVFLQELNEAMIGLPDHYRSALMLIGIQGMTYGEAAHALGVPVGTVRSRLSRGRAALLSLLS